ncbi:Uma2 family endonuclease [Kovacikia minuta]|uniref:Uma2 family endonuclease n=1 Tax=Kovacikia minuta TaxID=2931930 RepID=UPI0036F44B99
MIKAQSFLITAPPLHPSLLTPHGWAIIVLISFIQLGFSMVVQRPQHQGFAASIPPVESGDRLTRVEFERRYEAIPERFKAELIEGVVYVASPVRVFHGGPHAALVTWLGVYWAATPGVKIADNATIRLDLDNEPQPDVLLRIAVGGTAQISQDGYIVATSTSWLFSRR